MDVRRRGRAASARVPGIAVVTDDELIRSIPLATMLSESWAATCAHGVIEVLTDRDDTDAVAQVATRALGGRPWRVRRVARSTMQAAMLQSHDAAFSAEISHGFAHRFPALAVNTGVAWWQRATVAVIIALAATALWCGQLEIVITLLVLSACAATLLNVVAVLWAARMPSRTEPPLRDEELPTYSVIVPAYREADVIAELVRAIEQLDYPAHLLDVMILVEKHDPDTERVARSAGLPSNVRVVRIPSGAPQTKPRTCNLGLMLAGGDFLVVFDAEDRPERDQLRKAAARFAAAGPDLACVQAKLFFSNGSANLLTRAAELEYATRYEMILPGLIRMGLPIPLGGTSNHFRTESLRAVGGWDAWNVTEDADLGMRLATMGHRVEMIDSVTWEQAVPELGAWTRQRTRWFKGFLLTAGVHTRAPLTTLRQNGTRGLIVLIGILVGNVALASGQTLTLVIPLYVIGLIPEHHRMLTLCTWIAALAGAAVWMCLQTVAICRLRISGAWPAVLALPALGVAQNWAALRAMYHAAVRPYVWEKTPHRASWSGT